MKVSYDQHIFWSIPIKFNQMHILSCEIIHCGFYNFCKYSSIWKCKSNVLESIYNLGFLVEYSVCCKILEENDLIELSLFFLHPWPALKCNLHFMHFLKTAPGLGSPLPTHCFRKVFYISVMPFSRQIFDIPWNGKKEHMWLIPSLPLFSTPGILVFITV